MIRKSSVPTTVLCLPLILVILAMAAGCGGVPRSGPEAEPVETQPGAKPEPSGTPMVPAGSSAVAGVVTFNGKIRNLRPISMSAAPDCAAKHAGPVESEALVLGEGNMIANVFVRVKGGLPDREWPKPSEPVVLDQRGCRYSPHVLGVMVGQPFKILNSDGLLHNVYALPRVNREFNMGMPASRTEAIETFNMVEDMFKIKCDVHPWMKAYVGVMGHPYFQVTREDGKFILSDLPAGTYEIEAWHEKLGILTALVSVADGESTTVDFTFTM